MGLPQSGIDDSFFEVHNSIELSVLRHFQLTFPYGNSSSGSDFRLPGRTTQVNLFNDAVSLSVSRLCPATTGKIYADIYSLDV